MNDIYQLLTDNFIKGIISGKKIDLDKVPDKTILAAVAAHCCLNGPVGVNTKTTFPEVDGETTIKEVVGQKISNSDWRLFCADVAKNIKPKYDCNMYREFKQYWPACENELRARVESQKKV